MNRVEVGGDVDRLAVTRDTCMGGTADASI